MAGPDVSAALETLSQAGLALRDPDRWSGVACMAARALSGGRALVSFLDAQGRMLVRACPETDPDWHARYDAEMHAANYLWADAACRPAGCALTDPDTAARRRYHRSTIFNEFVAPQGFDALMTLTLSDRRLGMVGLLTIGRRKGQEPFDRSELDFGARLAGAIARMIAACPPVFPLDGPDPDETREALLTPEGRVLRHEPWFADWSRAGIIEIRQGVLSIPLLPGLGAALRATGRPVEGWPPPVAMVIGPVETALGRIRVSLLRGGRPARGAVRLRITLEAERDPRLRLAQAFRLTPRECEIACLLAAGCSLPEAAERLGIGLATARTHLARAFDKTETRTQLQLGLLAHQWLRGNG